MSSGYVHDSRFFHNFSALSCGYVQIGGRKKSLNINAVICGIAPAVFVMNLWRRHMNIKIEYVAVD